MLSQIWSSGTRLLAWHLMTDQSYAKPHTIPTCQFVAGQGHASVCGGSSGLPSVAISAHTSLAQVLAVRSCICQRGLAQGALLVACSRLFVQAMGWALGPGPSKAAHERAPRDDVVGWGQRALSHTCFVLVFKGFQTRKRHHRAVEPPMRFRRRSSDPTCAQMRERVRQGLTIALCIAEGHSTVAKWPNRYSNPVAAHCRAKVDRAAFPGFGGVSQENRATPPKGPVAPSVGMDMMGHFKT